MHTGCWVSMEYYSTVLNSPKPNPAAFATAPRPCPWAIDFRQNVTINTVIGSFKPHSAAFCRPTAAVARRLSKPQPRAPSQKSGSPPNSCSKLAKSYRGTPPCLPPSPPHTPPRRTLEPPLLSCSRTWSGFGGGRGVGGVLWWGTERRLRCESSWLGLAWRSQKSGWFLRYCCVGVGVGQKRAKAL